MGNNVRKAFKETCITRALSSLRHNRNVESNSANIPNWISLQKEKKTKYWLSKKNKKLIFQPNLELSCESVDTSEHWLIKELLNEFDNDDIGGDIVKRWTVVWINLASKFAHAPRKCGSPCSRKDKRYVIT